MAPHAGLAQVTRVGATAFHWDRRWRVLLRDIFRFGTATVLSYVGGPAGTADRVPYMSLLRSSCSGSFSVLSAAHRGSTGASCLWSGIVREPRTALGAQSWTVVLAQRLERQCEHHRVPQQGLQVDQVVLERADLELLIRIDVVVVVDEQLLEPHLDLVGDRLQAPRALTSETRLTPFP